MAGKIDSVKAREALKVRREPYWSRVSKGCYLGFRKMTDTGAGNWIARALDANTGKQAYHALGGLETVTPADRFDAAKAEAEKWFTHLGMGGTTETVKVRKACEDYVSHVRAEKGDTAADDIKGRFERWVYGDKKFADCELAKLTRARVEAWRKALSAAVVRVGRRRSAKKPPRPNAEKGQPVPSARKKPRVRSASTVNRDMTALRAALNLAHDTGHVVTDNAWRVPLRPIKNADRRRELYLDRAQRRLFIEKAAPDLAEFLRGLALLPLRPGALAALTAGDYDKRLKLLRIGKDKAGADRKIRLPDTTAALFDEAVKGKLPTAPLLARADGKAWDKDAWKGPVKAAARAAELPGATTAYALRHSVITDLVVGGLDLLTVAQISGTSVAMIEKHYGSLRADIAASALAKLSL